MLEASQTIFSKLTEGDSLWWLHVENRGSRQLHPWGTLRGQTGEKKMIMVKIEKKMVKIKTMKIKMIKIKRMLKAKMMEIRALR